jgi:hypothetical protein
MKLTHCSIGAAALCLGSLAFAPRASSAELALPTDGWTSWEVAAVDGAPDYCCWSDSRNFRDSSRSACRLDARQQSYGSRNHASTDLVRIYARTAGGKIDHLRALSAACPVETETPIRDLGRVAEDESARWLVDLIQQRDTDKRHVEEDVLAALAVNRGAARDLIRLGNTDRDSEVRAQAWFWLANLGAPEAENAIFAALRKESNDEVRERAIIALAQLPEARATQALIAVAEDRSQSRELRKRAVFWLSQSDSDAAQSYLEQILTVNY